MELDTPSELTEELSASTQLLRNSPDSGLTSRSTPWNSDDEKGNSGSILELVNSSAGRDDHLEPRPPSPSLYQTGLAITRIEELIEAMADCILGKRNKLTIKLKSRSSRGANPTVDSKQNTRSVNFPSTSPREAWKFITLLRILELSHEALVTGNVITKRDLYYRDPELFAEQSFVDRYLDDIAYTLSLKRDALNVVAAAKGLLTGCLTVTKKDGSVIDYSSGVDLQLVPAVMHVEEVVLHGIAWILVVEKEATFRTLATSEYCISSGAGKGIILTAKGYPDVQSRQFLHFVSKRCVQIPIFAFVDFDPDGIGIMSTYKYGSKNLAHESADLSVPSIRWLGVRSADMVEAGETAEGVMRLTERDRRLAVKMLERDLYRDGGEETEWRRELQVMLVLNRKAEIQILGNGSALEKWLDRKLQEHIDMAKL
ncbi:meiotic recombination spo11 protein [Rutstroemia sp. NJR-2017a BBW]|nr:meiotic recombination spo11 protein [Rutstroemia sp. NJR-2017a BBW]